MNVNNNDYRRLIFVCNLHNDFIFRTDGSAYGMILCPMARPYSSLHLAWKIIIIAVKNIAIVAAGMLYTK